MRKTVDQMSKDELVQLARFDSIIRNNGFDPETERNMSMTDALDLPSAAIMIPRVLTQFVQEGVEPLLVGTSLLQRVEYQPGIQTVYPAIDVLQAREVGDGMAVEPNHVYVIPPNANLYASLPSSFALNPIGFRAVKSKGLS